MALLFGGTETGGDDVSAHVQATVSTTEQQHAGDETVPELNASRGFQVVHQRLVLDVDVERRTLRGYTELTLTSLADHDLSTIRLHCRQCHVDSVRVDGVNITDFIHRDHLGAMPVVDAGDRDAGDGDASGGSMAGANNTDGGTRDARMHPRFKEEFVAALVRASHGELVVRLPQTSMEVVKKDNAAAGDTATGEADAAVTSEEAVAAAGDADASAFAPDSPITSTTTPTSRDIILRVDFTLTDPAIGAFFCNPGTASSAAITHPYVYTCNQYLQSRAWFPCVDEPTERCTWSMEYVVPRFYNGGEGGGGNDGAGDDTRDWIVVSAGEIQEQVVHPHDPAKKIVFYQSTVPIPAQSILFVLAPFAVVPIPGFPYGACAGYAFCMPGKERMVEESLGFLAKAMEFYTQHIGVSYPFRSAKFCFLEDIYQPSFTGCALSVLGAHLLHGDDVIDQTFETRRMVSRALAAQWFGQYIFAKSWADTWLVLGIANYLAGLFVRKMFGDNEYRFRMKKDMERIHELDVNRPTLYPASPLEARMFEDMENDEFLNLKAPVVIYMLERFLGKNLLQRIINKLAVSTISGDLTDGLSTHYFLRLLKKTSGKDLTDFANQWIYGAGSPRLNCSYHYNKKKNIIELKVQQDPTRVKYVGTLTVRVHEPDGTFDHVVALDDHNHKFDLLYHTKYKRLRNNKKAQMREIQAQRELEERERAIGLRAPPGCEADEDMCANDPELVGELKKADWILGGADGGELEGLVMNYSILWIRLDPDMELLIDIKFKQQDYEWNQQLTKDKDVVAQYEAVRGMESMSTYKVCSCLFRCLMDVRTFYRVRMECAYAMARGFSLQRLDDVGVKLLFLAYRKKFCASIQPPMPNTLPAFPPKRNDFRTITEYYVQKAIISGLAQSNPDRPILGSIIRNFLLDQLKLNDNTQNQYNDAHYIASLVKAIGSTYVVTQDLKPAIAALPSNFQGPSLNDALVEVERFLFLETQLPTYRNIVASACLSVLLTWMMHGLIPSDVKPFLVFSRPGNFIDVRLMALSGLVVTGLSTLPERSINANAGSVGGTTDDSSSDPRVVAIMDYLIHLIKTDTHYMRFAVVRCISDYVAGLSSIVRKQAEDEEAKAERDRMEKERADLARNAGEEPEVEDLGMGIEQRVDNMRRTESGDVAAVFKHLAEMKAFRIDMWKLFNHPVCIHDFRLRRAILSLLELLYEVKPKPIPLPTELAPRLTLISPMEFDNDGDYAMMAEAEDMGQLATPRLKLRLDVPSSTKSYAAASPVSSMPPTTPLRIRLSLTAPPDLTHLGNDEQRVARHAIEQLRNHPAAAAFLLPVDTVAYPNYTQLVSNPVDLTTIRKRFDSDKYQSLGDLARDIRLVFTNCYIFNVEGSHVYTQAKKLEAFYTNEIEALLLAPKDQPAGLTEDEKRRASLMLSKLLSQPFSYFFSSPVDPVRDGAPDYLEVVDHPMDFGTIKDKLKAGRYFTLGEYEKDVELVFTNCFLYNKAPATAVYQGGRTLEQLWRKEWRRLNAGRGTSSAGNTPMTPTAPTLPTSNAEPMFAIPASTTVMQSKPTPVPRPPPPPLVPPLTRTELDALKPILDDVARHPAAGPFLQPVDWRALNLLDYPLKIKTPMDFGTIGTKAAEGRYVKAKQVENDVRLLFNNCYRYNDKEAPVCAMGREVEAMVMPRITEWRRLVEAGHFTAEPGASQAAIIDAMDVDGVAQESSDNAVATNDGSASSITAAVPAASAPVAVPATSAATPSSTSAATPTTTTPTPALPTTTPEVSYAALRAIHKRLVAHKSSLWFRLPVDPVRQNVPHYPLIITRPMDLSTVGSKIKDRQYASMAEFEADIRLIVENCLLFNGAEAVPSLEALKMEKLFDKLLRDLGG